MVVEILDCVFDLNASFVGLGYCYICEDQSTTSIYAHSENALRCSPVYFKGNGCTYRGSNCVK